MLSRNKWVVFDVPSQAQLLTALQAHFAGTGFLLQRTWRLPTTTPAEEIPVWCWEGSAEEFAGEANVLLREFIYPLTASNQPFVLGLPFSRNLLQPVDLDLNSLERLDLEDIGRLLHAAVNTTFELLPTADHRLAQTPIEEQLSIALAQIGVVAEPQVKLGRFRADFVVEHQGEQIVVEADGRGFHDPEADMERDQALQALGVRRVIRFTGSQIYRGPEKCALEVRQFLQGVVPRRGFQADDQLDASQARAAQHSGGAARVLAPAGAGKTKTMIARVLELLRHGVPPGSILLLAFNKKAAEQLQLRLGHLGVPLTRDLVPYSEGVFCSTFHAFGYRYQTQMIQLRPTIESEEKAWRDLMERAVADTGVRVGDLKPTRGSDPIGQFLRALDRVKADLQNPAQVEVEIESFGAEGNRVLPFAPVFEAFQARQLSSGQQSFDDQLYITIRDLLQSPARRRALQCRFEHVLVDEFQDLNAAQLTLVDIISRPHRKLFVVGDDDQLIYGFRFAKPSNILDFHSRVPPEPYSATYTLSTNYRCSKAVVESSRRLIDRNRLREPKDFRAAPNAPSGVVRFCPSPSWNDRAAQIAAFLRIEKARLGCKWQHLAVLCRYKAQQPPVAMALDAEKIPRSPLLKYRLYTHQTAELLRAYIDLVRDPESLSGDRLASILNRPERYIKKADLGQISSSNQAWQALKDMRDAAALAPRAVGAFIRSVEVLHEQAPSMTSPDLVESIIQEFDLERYWTDQTKRAAGMEQDDAGPLQVIEILRMLAGDLHAIEGFLAQWDAARDREIERNDTAPDELVREEPEVEDHVVIGTIHSAKGREYKAVVLVDYDPDLNRMLNDSQLEEERRVLYVGVTRAQQSLLLTVDERKPVNLLLKELIRPRESPTEERSVREQIAQKRSEALSFTAEAERHREALRALEDGREERRLQEVLRGQQEKLAATDRAIQVVCLEFEGLQPGGAPAISSVEAASLRDALRIARDRAQAVIRARDAVAQEQATARARGGWSPSNDSEKKRWEAELDRLHQRTSTLEIEADRLSSSRNHEGWRGMLDRLSGKAKELEQRRTQLLEEGDNLSARAAAMLQSNDLSGTAARYERETTDLQREITRLERLVALAESFDRLVNERRSRESALHEAENNLSVLRSRPDLLRGDLRQKISEAEQRVAQAESDHAVLESRLIELSLL